MNPYVMPSVTKRFESIRDELIRRILSQDFDFISIGVFGSFARGDYKGTSDVDICVIVKELPPRSIKGWLYDDAEELGADLIFVTLNSYETSETSFMQNLRRDYVEVVKSDK